MKLEIKYSFISILKDMFREKIFVIVTILICLVLGAITGYLDYKKGFSAENDLDSKLASQSAEEEEYITQLRNYESSLSECEAALALAEEQRDNLQSYIDRSILMKIDPDDVKVAYAAFVVQDRGDTENTVNKGDILSAIQSYINDGGLKADALSQGAEELDPEGWKEIISVGNSGSNLFITIVHYDPDKAGRVMDIVKKCLDSSKADIAKIHGDYELVLMDESSYTKVDNNIANTQNNNYNNLKSYSSSVSEQLNRYNNQLNTIRDFKERNEITESKSAKRGLGKNLMLFSVAGLFGGLILSFAILGVKVAVSDTIVCADHLRYAGLVILNEYFVKKKAFKTDVKETGSILARNAKKAGADKVCIYSVGGTDSNKEIGGILGENLSIEVCGNDKLYECDQVVAVLTAGKNRYSEVETLLGICAQNNIAVIGFVVCG